MCKLPYKAQLALKDQPHSIKVQRPEHSSFLNMSKYQELSNTTWIMQLVPEV